MIAVIYLALFIFGGSPRATFRGLLIKYMFSLKTAQHLYWDTCTTYTTCFDCFTAFDIRKSTFRLTDTWGNTQDVLMTPGVKDCIFVVVFL